MLYISRNWAERRRVLSAALRHNQGWQRPGQPQGQRERRTPCAEPWHAAPRRQVLQKIMGDQDLATAFSNPNVQKAVLDISSNPMNIVNYQNDPDVMKVRRPHTRAHMPPPAPRNPACDVVEACCRHTCTRTLSAAATAATIWSSSIDCQKGWPVLLNGHALWP